MDYIDLLQRTFCLSFRLLIRFKSMYSFCVPLGQDYSMVHVPTHPPLREHALWRSQSSRPHKTDQEICFHRPQILFLVCICTCALERGRYWDSCKGSEPSSSTRVTHLWWLVPLKLMQSSLTTGQLVHCCVIVYVCVANKQFPCQAIERTWHVSFNSVRVCSS